MPLIPSAGSNIKPPRGEWPGQALDGGLPSGRTDCVLTLRPPYLFAALPSGERLRVDLRRASCARGGPGRRLFVFATGEPGEPSFTTEDESLLAAVRSLGIRGFDRPKGRAVRPAARRPILAAGSGALLVGLVHVLLLGPLAPFGARLVPVSVDDDLGLDALVPAVATMSPGPPTERTDPAIRAVIDTIVLRLAMAAVDRRFNFRVQVFESPVVNAFALPGGRIVVTTGLLREIDSPDELAGVIAHEMSHITGRHQIERLVHIAGLRMILQSLAGRGATLGRRLVEEGEGGGLRHLSFSREMETQADREAVQLLNGALISPAGFDRFMHKLDRLEEASGAREHAFTRTHPLTAKRLRAIEDAISALRPTRYLPLLVDWPALLAALGARSEPEEGAREGAPASGAREAR